MTCSIFLSDMTKTIPIYSVEYGNTLARFPCYAWGYKCLTQVTKSADLLSLFTIIMVEWQKLGPLLIEVEYTILYIP